MFQKKILKSLDTTMRPTAILWTGLGTGRDISEQLLKTLDMYMDVVPINNPLYFINEEWETKTNVFAIGGGYASGMIKELHTDHPEALKRIKNFIASGNLYLGFCAGAYFATSHILFKPLGQEIDSPLDKNVISPFALMKGSGIGPVYEGYSDKNEESAQVIGLKLNGKYHKMGVYDISTFYLGGGEFCPEQDVDIIAYYSDFPEKIAMLKTNYGNGQIFLSGPHPEVFNHKYNKEIDSQLTQSHPERKKFLDILFSDLLTVNSQSSKA